MKISGDFNLPVKFLCKQFALDSRPADRTHHYYYYFPGIYWRGAIFWILSGLHGIIITPCPSSLPPLLHAVYRLIFMAHTFVAFNASRRVGLATVCLTALLWWLIKTAVLRAHPPHLQQQQQVLPLGQHSAYNKQTSRCSY